MLNMVFLALRLISLVMIPAFCCAHDMPEKFYQDKWCNEYGGITEYRLQDGAKVDCLTDTHAVEFDFALKWAEAIGQALFYSAVTGKRAGIVLILEDDEDVRHLIRLRTTILYNSLPIDVFEYF